MLAVCLLGAVAATAAVPGLSYSFVFVSDLDRASHMLEGSRSVWRAWLQHGELLAFDDTSSADCSADACSRPRRRYRVRMGGAVELFSKHAYKDRGMELSDLVQFGEPGDLWSVCDSTGLLYRLPSASGGGNRRAVLPQRVLLDDDGSSSMPCKSEWMAVKDGSLYVGGHGKEWVDRGVVKGRGAEWVRVVGADGTLKYEDWHDRYAMLRAATNTSFPGYVSHEAVDWDDVSRQWVMAPRKAQYSSVEGGYDDKTDELRGTNLLLTVSEDFDTVGQLELGALDLAWGASGIRLLPTADGDDAQQQAARHVLVVSSSEQGDHAESSIGVFSMDDGQSLLLPDDGDDLPVDGGDAVAAVAVAAADGVVWYPVGSRKYEGVSFLSPP